MCSHRDPLCVKLFVALLVLALLLIQTPSQSHRVCLCRAVPRYSHLSIRVSVLLPTHRRSPPHLFVLHAEHGKEHISNSCILLDLEQFAIQAEEGLGVPRLADKAPAPSFGNPWWQSYMKHPHLTVVMTLAHSLSLRSVI